MHSAKGVNSPTISGRQLTVPGSETVKDIQLYKSIVRALQYATITKPEITFKCKQSMSVYASPFGDTLANREKDPKVPCRHA